MSFIQSIFEGLTGSWLFSRTINSFFEHQPSGLVSGRANFSSVSQGNIAYKDSGEFKTNSGQLFNISRMYRYRYDEQKNDISVYFVEGHATHRLFYTLAFALNGNPFLATGRHVCGQDTYLACYDFRYLFEKKYFLLNYDVKGPNKQYISMTRYDRK